MLEMHTRGFRCRIGVGFHTPDVNDLFLKTIAYNCSTSGYHDESKDCLMAVQARHSGQLDFQEEDDLMRFSTLTENTEIKSTLDRTTMMNGRIGTWKTQNLILVMKGMRTLVL